MVTRQSWWLPAVDSSQRTVRSGGAAVPTGRMAGSSGCVGVEPAGWPVPDVTSIVRATLARKAPRYQKLASRLASPACKALSSNRAGVESASAAIWMETVLEPETKSKPGAERTTWNSHLGRHSRLRISAPSGVLSISGFTVTSGVRFRRVSETSTEKGRRGGTLEGASNVGNLFSP